MESQPQNPEFRNNPEDIHPMAIQLAPNMLDTSSNIDKDNDKVCQACQHRVQISSPKINAPY